MPLEKASRREPPTEKLKSVALRLFAERGIDGVTVRQIAEALGSRNHSALTYHFGSKEALVRELIIDGARAIDERRNAWLDAAEASGGPFSVAEVAEGLLRTSIDPAPPPSGECFNRFVVHLHGAHRPFLMEVLADRWNIGYQRAIDHMRRLVPDTAPGEMNRRLIFMGAALGGILASRESELADTSRPHPMWSDDTILSDAAKSLAAMIDLGGRPPT